MRFARPRPSSSIDGSSGFPASSGHSGTEPKSQSVGPCQRQAQPFKKQSIVGLRHVFEVLLGDPCKITGLHRLRAVQYLLSYALLNGTAIRPSSGGLIEKFAQIALVFNAAGTRRGRHAKKGSPQIGLNGNAFGRCGLGWRGLGWRDLGWGDITSHGGRQIGNAFARLPWTTFRIIHRVYGPRPRVMSSSESSRKPTFPPIPSQ